MPLISVGKHISATPEEVFAVVADLENAPNNLNGIEKVEILTEGPIGLGTRFRETRNILGVQGTDELEITQFDAPHGYVVKCESSGTHFRIEFQLMHDIYGTHLRVNCDAQPKTIVAKMLFPITTFMSNTTQKCIDAVLEEIKRVAEANAAPVVHS